MTRTTRTAGLLALLLPAIANAELIQPPGLAPGEAYHRIFVTASDFGISSSTSFPPPFGVINGLPGADWHVTLAAFSSGLLPTWNGTDLIYTAILSTSTVNAIDRFAISGKVFNTQNEKIADNFADFWDGSLDAAIRYDEFGVAVSTSDVWSGSISTGVFAGSNCGDWTDNGTTGEIGDATVSGTPWLGTGSKKLQ